MYSPAAFRQDDLATLHQQMRATRLPTLVSHGTQDLLASHLPLLLETGEGPMARCTATSPGPTRSGVTSLKAARRW